MASLNRYVTATLTAFSVFLGTIVYLSKPAFTNEVYIMSMANGNPIYDIATANSQRSVGRSQFIPKQTTLGQTPSSRRQRTTRRSQNADSSLVTAIRNTVGVDSELFAQIEYFFTEVDLNNDGNKEVIVYTAGVHCGAYECPVSIFTSSATAYRLIGIIASQSNDGQIAVLSSRSNGWFDIATLVYDSQQGRSNWKLNRFNGSSYENTYRNLSSTPSQIVLRPNRGSGISLAK